MYSSKIGRFTRADALYESAELTVPQSLNRYLYVLNHPLAYTDTTGFIWVKKTDGTPIGIKDSEYDKNSKD